MSIDEDRRPGGPEAPLVPLALAVAVGIAADRFGPAWETVSWAALAAGAAALGGLMGRRPIGVLALLVAFAALGGGWHHHRWSDLAPDDLARGLSGPRPAWVRGVVLDVATFRPGLGPDDPGTTRTVLQITGISDGRLWHPASGKALLTIHGDRTDLPAGSAVRAAGTLGEVSGPLNPGEFDYREHLRARGIRLALSVDDPEGVRADPDAPSSPWVQWLGGLRARAHDLLEARLDPKSAPLAAALLLGRREGVDPEVNDAFARTGTMHLLAISGLHMQALAGALWLVCRALRIGRRRSYAAIAASTLAYALLVGFMPSVTRSAAMTVIFCAAAMRDRYTRPANDLAWAALATMAWNPSDLFDVGCQLSFLGVAALFWGVPAAASLFHRPPDPLDALEHRLEPLWKTALRKVWAFVLLSIAASLVAWLATMPLVALRFHLVSPIGIPLNLPLIPITSLALMLAGLTLLLSFLGGPIAAPAAWLCSLLLHWTESIVRWGAARPWGHAFVAGPPLEWLLVFYALLALALGSRRGRRPLRLTLLATLAAWAVLGVILAARPGRPESLEADVLAVGHGLSVVIHSPDGRAVLYDCGRLGDPRVGRRILAPALWSRRIHRLDTVVLSHADADHYNGLPDLLDRFPIGELRVPPGFASPANPGASRLLDQVRSRGIPVREIVSGDRLALGPSASLVALHPPSGWQPDAPDNARSVVLDLSRRDRHFLLTGDLDGLGLRALLASPPLSPSALLSPHHGGRTANPAAFYEWAGPATVIVSQRRPPYEGKDALTPLSERGVPVLRTWERGAVRLVWGEEGVEAKGFLDGEHGER